MKPVLDGFPWIVHHTSLVFDKIGVASRTEAAIYALRQPCAAAVEDSINAG